VTVISILAGAEAIGSEAKSRLTGRRHKVTIDVKEMKNEIKISSLRFSDYIKSSGFSDMSVVALAKTEG